MVKGVGIDIIRIEELEKAIKDDPGLLANVFTDREIAYCSDKRRKYETFSGKFCAKEALLKALGVGVVGVSLKDVEVLNDADTGAPYVLLHDRLKELSDKRSVKAISISISHDGPFATAIVIIDGLDGRALLG